jgi:hypothetical protein
MTIFSSNIQIPGRQLSITYYSPPVSPDPKPKSLLGSCVVASKIASPTSSGIAGILDHHRHTIAGEGKRRQVTERRALRDDRNGNRKIADQRYSMNQLG